MYFLKRLKTHVLLNYIYLYVDKFLKYYCDMFKKMDGQICLIWISTIFAIIIFKEEEEEENHTNVQIQVTIIVTNTNSMFLESSYPLQWD